MADEALVLSAVVVDRFSNPIKDMQKQLRALTAENARSHAQGVQLAKGHADSFMKLRESATKTADTFRREFTPVFKDFAETATGLRFSLTGIGGAAAAAVSGASAMAFSFAGTARSLRDLSQSTGMSVNDLRVFEQIGPRIGSSVEAMDGGLQSLNAHMERLKRNGFAELADMTGSMFPDVKNQVAQLAGLPRPEQFERLLDIAERIKHPGRGGGEANERRFLQFFGLPPELAEYSGKIRDVVAQIRQNLKPLSADQIMMGVEASVAWSNLQLRMKGFSDFIGATFAPALTRAIDGISALESGAAARFSKLVADPSISRSWDDLTARVGADLKSIIGSPADFAGLDTTFKNAVTGLDSVVKTLDSLTTDRHLDWAKLFSLPVMQEQIDKLRDGAKAIEAIYEKIPGYKALQETKGANTEATPIPGLSGIGAWLKSLSAGSAAPPTAPTAPAEPLHDRLPPPSAPPPAPFVLPKMGLFPKSETNPPRPAPPMPAFSPIAYRPTDGGDNPLSGASSSTSGAIQVISVGVRKGVYDGLFDFYQAMRGLAGKGGGGVMPASYETGGPGGVAGALGGGGGGTGAGGRRAGAGGLPNAPGGPAAAVGRAVRRQAHGGGSGGGQASGSELPPGTGGPLLDEISKSEGTRGYNDAFAHQHPGVDLSKLTINQVEALQRTQRGSPAIGRYQFMTATLEGLKKQLGLSGSEMFTPAMQERLARSLLQRRGYDQWKAGKLSDQAFMHNLSEEWAGLTDPYTGHGHYASIGQDTGHSLRQQFSALKAERDAKPATAVAGGPGRSPSGPAPTSISSTLAKHGEALRKMFGERGLQKAPTVERPPLPGQQDVSLRPGDLRRREPGSLLRAADQRQAAALKHEITGSASLHVKLAAGLAPVSGVKTKGDLFREVRLDRAPLALASTTG